MINVLGISGSLRIDSYNTALLRTLQHFMPENSVLEIEKLNEIPLYNGDIEVSEGIPEPVNELKERIISFDGLLLATPEYNSSIPGVLKNAIDWLSRPPKDMVRVFGNRPVGIIGASTGSFGTILSQTAWLPILRALGVHPFFGRSLYVSRAAEIFDGSGKLTDDHAIERAQRYVSNFVEFIRKTKQ